MAEQFSDIFNYVVGTGDTIEIIASAFNIPVNMIGEMNPGANLSELTPGQILQIPLPIGFCPSGNIYLIRSGDTLTSIAQRFGVTESAILTQNPLLRLLGVRPGLPICIPIPILPVCPGGFFYTVVAGDTLFSIAARFGTTVIAIIQANPGIDPTRLFVGQRICIPVPAPPVCPGGFFYTVVAGDTLFSIANRFGTTVSAIIQANPGIDPTRLFVGQRICIPGPLPPACPGFIYVVMPGDTLISIAARFNTTVLAILQFNPGITDPNFITVGQRICIPR